MQKDEKFMRIALELAQKGMPSPSPKVGCVIVKNGKIVGEGHHRFFGDYHAEIHALAQAGKKARGAIAYSTLEPCALPNEKSHACTTALINAGIKRVVFGSKDHNPIEEGRGRATLEKSGINVKTGVLEDACEQLVESYTRYITTKKPFVILHSAMSLDGRIATKTGESKYISGKESLRHVHKLRDNVDAILIGINTVLKDNPYLTSRKKGGKDPLRVILDSKLRIPTDANVLQDENALVVATEGHDKKTMTELKKKRIDVFIAKSKNNRIDLNDLMTFLGKKGISSLLVEGGSSVSASFIKEKLVDKFLVTIAPKIIGGDGIPIIESLGIEKLFDVVRVDIKTISRVGKDIIIESYVKKS